MPCWSVLTSGWGKWPAREREREVRQRDGSEIGQQGERKAKRRRGGMTESLVPYAGGSQRGRDTENMRLLSGKARTGEGE